MPEKAKMEVWGEGEIIHARCGAKENEGEGIYSRSILETEQDSITDWVKNCNGQR